MGASNASAGVSSPGAGTETNAEDSPPLQATPVTPETRESAATPSPDQFNLLHLRLLLNWTTSTCHSISRNSADLGIWQTVVPKMALSHPYLLHGLFAVSALHLSLPMTSQDPDREELIKAAEYHQSEAIRIFTPIVGNLTPSQYDATFTLSNLLATIALTFPLVHNSVAGRIPDVLNELIRVFAFVRKMTQFYAYIIESVTHGEIAQLTYFEVTRASLSDTIQSRVSALHELNTTHILDPEAYLAFRDTIDRLASTFARMYSGQEIFSACFLWMAQTPAQYFDRLQDRHPLALVILAHYCIVLDHMNRHWWIQSWGRQVLEAIRSVLEPGWRVHISWPLEVVGV
ncbi:uncharacterized protein KD926_003832 [Aspergillus affinis]|uniref:uncharacterized protein n=1 Tax=Aspergillus affinis TaxID=1070780 RepID=UPI0022FF4285|nr:uncharacterized protein KD926_003832 [Aspergillus affinis]KAI9043302.1 hypothetical protein KD926_003832 [Aspergillus affinis]